MKRTPHDQESQSLISSLDADPPANATTVATSSLGGSSSSTSNNPVMLAKMVLQKVLTMLTEDDGGDGKAYYSMDVYGILRILKDIFIGVLLAVIVISCAVFLDHINVIHLESAHNFREHAFAMLNDPETHANLKEAGLILIPMEDYNRAKHLYAYMVKTIEGAKKDIEEGTKELAEKQAEIGPLKEEYEKMLTNSNLGLEKWCGTCLWGGGGTCDARKEYFIGTYGHNAVSAKVAIMKQSPKCKGE